MVLTSGLNLDCDCDTVLLEYLRGKWNFRCSGGMRRYLKEHQWRRQFTGKILTLRHESEGSEQD